MISISRLSISRKISAKGKVVWEHLILKEMDENSEKITSFVKKLAIFVVGS